MIPRETVICFKIGTPGAFGHREVDSVFAKRKGEAKGPMNGYDRDPRRKVIAVNAWNSRAHLRYS